MARKPKKPGITIVINPDDSSSDIARKIAVQAGSSDDPRVQLAAARVLVQLGKVEERDEPAIDPQVMPVAQLIDLIGRLAQDGDPLEVMRRMSKTCRGCEKMGFSAEIIEEVEKP